jgi:hypothetical protein
MHASQVKRETKLGAALAARRGPLDRPEVGADLRHRAKAALALLAALVNLRTELFDKLSRLAYAIEKCVSQAT